MGKDEIQQLWILVDGISLMWSCHGHNWIQIWVVVGL
jgi:hypothetical protein